MITVRKGNIELDIADEQKDRYLKLGYSVFEGDKLVEEAPTTDVGALTSKIIELTTENAKLKAENAKLKSAAKKSIPKEN